MTENNFDSWVKDMYKTSCDLIIENSPVVDLEFDLIMKINRACLDYYNDCHEHGK